MNGGVGLKYFGDDLSPLHKQLSLCIRKSDCFNEAKELFLDIHGKLHLAEVSDGENSAVDSLTADLSEKEYHIMPTSRDETIAWSIWHIARIEDLTMGILAAGGRQVFNDERKSLMKSPFSDTGNAMSDDEILLFSNNVDFEELLRYRSDVGKRTREIWGELRPEDMRRRVSDSGLERIFKEGGVTSQENSAWLLDFWGGKDVAGLMLMPATRHQIVHLNACFKYKEFMRTKKRYYRD